MAYINDRVCSVCGDSSPRADTCGECQVAARAFAEGQKVGREEGAAVAFGLMGTAHEIRERECEKNPFFVFAPK